MNQSTFLNPRRVILVIIIAAVLVLGIAASVQLGTRLSLLESKVGSLESDVQKLREENARLTQQTSAAMESLTSPGENSSKSSIAQIYKHIQPSVISLSGDFRIGDFLGTLEGSGFVFDKEGFIVTNSHLVVGAERIRAVVADGSDFEAELVGADAQSDLAIVRIKEHGHDLSPLRLGDSKDVSIGEDVVLVGGSSTRAGSVSTGVVSQKGGVLYTNNPFPIVNVIQVNARLAPGTSGGPVLNLKGEVIGISTTTAAGPSTSYVIPSETLVKVLPALLETGYYRHAWLGVYGQGLTTDTAVSMGLEPSLRGLLVVTVVNGSPAEKAGLRGASSFKNGHKILGGDVITQADQVQIKTVDDILLYIEKNKKPGDSVTLTILRNGNVYGMEVVLGTLPL